MSAHFRAAAIVRELRSALRVARRATARFLDGRTQPSKPAPAAAKPLFLESALAAAESMRAPIVSNL